MNENLKKILKKDANWTVNKTDFSSKEMQESLNWVNKMQQEAEVRKIVDPAKLKLVVKL